MPALDIRTLSFLAMFSSLLLAGGLQLAQRQIPDDASLRLWARGATATGAAYVLYGMRTLLPDLLSIVLANTLLTMGAVWLYLGNREFQRLKPQFPWYWVMTAVVAGCFTYFTHFAPDLRVRIMLVAVVTAAMCFGSGMVMLPRQAQRDRTVHLYVASAFLIAAVFFSARLVTTWWAGGLGQDFMVLTDPMQTYALVIGICLNAVLGVGLPILVSGRVQERLAHSEERHRLLYAGTPAIMHSIDATGRIVSVSDQWVKTFGYSRDQAIGQKSSVFLTEASRQNATDNVLPAFFRTGLCVDVPYQYVTADGRVLDMLLSATAERDAGGRIVRSMAVMTDVTERNRAVAALNESESRFRGAFEAAAHGMALVSIDGRFIKVNASLCTMLAYSEAELLSTDFQTITHPDDLQADLSLLDDMLHARIPSYQMEKRYVHKTGRLIWILLSVTLVRDQNGGPVHFVSQIQDITEKKRAIERLEHLLAEQRAILDNDLIGIAKVHNRRIMWANPAFENMMGYFAGETAGVETRRHYVSEAAFQAFGAKAYPVLAAGKVFRGEMEHVRRDGGRIWVDVSGAVLDQGSGVSLWGFLDITQRREQGRVIALSEQRMEMALAGADLALWDLDLVHGRAEHNARAFSMLGLDPATVEHSSTLVAEFESLVHLDDLAQYHQAFIACLKGAAPRLNIEIRLRHTNGHWIWANIRGKVVEHDGQGRAVRMVGTNLDVSARKEHEAKIYELAFFDPLTNLPNRRLLMDRLALALPASARRDAYGAVMFLDLDNFKSLNDTRGHDFGDLLLKEVASRLLSCVRSEDTVARPAGDEFVIMLNSLDAHAQAAGAEALAIGEKIRMALNEPYRLPGYWHVCTCSIGIALFKGTQETVGELIKRADIAMYQAKSAGRNAVQLFLTGA